MDSRFTNLRDPITWSKDDEGVSNHLQNEKNLRFHETILSFGEPGSLGFPCFKLFKAMVC